MFASPFTNITKNVEKKLSYTLFYLLLISITVMRYFDRFLINETAEFGIVSFELSNTLERAQEILDSWSTLSRTYAGLSLGYDFLFLFIYTLFIAVLIHKLNQRLWLGKTFYKLGEILIWSMFLTAIFDVIENVSLIKLLVGGRQQFWVSIAYYFAVVKFVLIFISILYIISNFFVLLFKKRS
jgi:hypothetical protein